MINNKTNIIELQRVLDEAINVKDRETIIDTTKELILYYQKKNDASSCILYAKSLIPYVRMPGEESNLAYYLSYIGKCYAMLEEYTEAEDFYFQSLKIYQVQNLQLGVAELESNLGILYRNRGIFDISLSHLTNAIEIYNANKKEMKKSKKPNYWYSYINAIEACGIIYGQLKQYDESIKFLEDALKLKEEHLGSASKVSSLMNLGVTYSEIDVNKAMACYLEALAESNDATPISHKIVLMNNLGGCLEDKNNLDDALNYYDQAMKLMEISGQMRYKAPILKHIATIYYKQGLFDKALILINESLKLSQKVGVKFEIEECYLTLSDIFTAKQDYQTALEYRKKYDTLKDEIYQKDLNTQLADLQKKYAKTTHDVSLLRQEKSLITDELKKNMNTAFIGVSESIKEVKRLATEAANFKDTKVLITGESGVGKEIVARLIHYSDIVSNGRFVDVNCCSIPESMAESEFFGFIRGSFTGAINNKSGYFEEANHGSLFLDEIGDMPLSLQAKLLRVLETKQVNRLGSNKANSIEFRLISATNKDISELINTNQFRADLFYRINTVEINIPPLRERKEDIKPLVEYFISEFSKSMNKVAPECGRDVIACLQEYSFPGNVRELKNMVEKAMIFMKNNKFIPEDFTNQMRDNVADSTLTNYNHSGNLHDLQDKVLLETLKECGGNQTMAAKQMGISYSTFKRKYKKLKES